MAKSFGVGWQILEVGVGRSTFLGGVPKNFGGNGGGEGMGLQKMGRVEVVKKILGGSKISLHVT